MSKQLAMIVAARLDFFRAAETDAKTDLSRLWAAASLANDNCRRRSSYFTHSWRRRTSAALIDTSGPFAPYLTVGTGIVRRLILHSAQSVE